MTRSSVAPRRKLAETRGGVVAGKSWGMRERSNKLFRGSDGDGPSGGGGAVHCVPPEFSCEFENHVSWPGVDGSVDRCVSKRNAPRSGFMLSVI